MKGVFKCAMKDDERRLGYIMSPLYGQAMLLTFTKLDLVASCLAKGIKESAYWEATQNVFTFSFSGLDALLLLYQHHCIFIFKLCAKF